MAKDQVIEVRHPPVSPEEMNKRLFTERSFQAMQRVYGGSLQMFAAGVTIGVKQSLEKAREFHRAVYGYDDTNVPE